MNRNASISLILLVAGITGCSSAPAELADLNLDPQSKEEALAAAEELSALMKESPADAELAESAEILSRKLEELSGLVSRIDLGAGHWVSFLQNEDGSVTVTERMPEGSQSGQLAKPETARMSLGELHRFLAPALAVPAELTSGNAGTVPVVEPATEGAGGGTDASSLSSTSGSRGDGLGTLSEALTAADGQWFRDNQCPAGFNLFCLPNHANGFFSEFYRRYSQIIIAPFGGALVTVRARRNGNHNFSTVVFSGELKLFRNNGIEHQEKQDPDCGWPWACATHLIEAKMNLRWDILDASGDSFHVSSNHWN
jgi:hypothetical protein